VGYLHHARARGSRQLATFHEVLVLDKTPIIPTKFVYKVKPHADGTVDRFKARLVAQGFRQIPARHFDESALYSPTLRYDALRLLLATAAYMHKPGDPRWQVCSADVTSAYLNAEVPESEQLYLEPPPFYTASLVAPPGYKVAFRCRRAINGLKQAGRLWWETNLDIMAAIGFETIDTCWAIYRRTRADGSVDIADLFVDDFLLLSNSPSPTACADIVDELKGYYEIKYLGPVSSFLGINVKQDNVSIFMTMPNYITECLERFELSDVKLKSSTL
jgi:hypothetical protein